MVPTVKMPPKLKVVRPPKIYSEDYSPKTVGEEVEWLVTQWYAELGQPIPPEEVGIGAKLDAMERERFDAEFQIVRETPKEVFEEDVKPEFGTPAFWAWTWRQKAKKNAERAAQGLPPLPTKKEAEAAKAQKAKERAAAKAEKEAEKIKKAAEKIKKAEEKAATKSAKN